MLGVEHEEVRESEPAEVWRGPASAPVALVLDPAGEVRQGELPATWHELTTRLRVGWVGLDGAQVDEAALDRMVDALGRRNVHLVAAGDIVDIGLRVAVRNPFQLRSFIAIDPRPERAADPETGCADASLWPEGGWAQQVLTEDGVALRCFLSTDEPDRSTGQPVSLGHPHVVRWVAEMVGATVAPSRRRGGLVHSWRMARRDRRRANYRYATST